MFKHYLKLLLSVAVFLIAATASAQEPLKIGMVLEMSGGFADFGMQMMNGARAYMKVHGDMVAGRKVELIVRDTTGVPDVAKRVAQELVTNDKVDFLACAVKRRRFPVGESPTRQPAPAGSTRSDYGGNEMVEASG